MSCLFYCYFSTVLLYFNEHNFNVEDVKFKESLMFSWFLKQVSATEEETVKYHNPTQRVEESEWPWWKKEGWRGEWINSFSVISQSGRGTKVSTTLIPSSLSPSSSSSMASVSCSVWCHPLIFMSLHVRLKCSFGVFGHVRQMFKHDLSNSSVYESKQLVMSWHLQSRLQMVYTATGYY